jgi:putative ABC transport system permease protein
VFDGLWSDLRYRLRALVRGADLDREIQDEIDAHLARETAVLERRGLSPEEARREARLAFGGVEVVKESARDARGTRVVEDAVRDIGLACRGIRRSPGLAVPIVALLALTIGSATVVFSVVNAVLLRPLPFGDPDRIAFVWETRPKAAQNLVGGHEFPEWARSNRTFDGLSPIIYEPGVQLIGAGDPAALLAARVGGSFFDVMGVAPAIGRGFSTAPEPNATGDVAVLSDRLWRSRFAADPRVIGRVVRLDERQVQVVGVMPPGFAFPAAPSGVTPDLWVPINENIERYVGRHYLLVVGRVKRGVTMAQAQADLASVARVLEARYPDDSGGHGVGIAPLQESLIKGVRPSLLLLLGAVGCLLLIGCSNVASLLTARGVSRRRQVAMQLALGATRGRLVRQMIVESLVLSGAGGALGLALAAAMVGLVPALVPPGALSVDAIALDRTVLAFVAGVVMLTGLVFGVVPALQVSHGAPADALSHGGRTLVGGHERARRGLVVAQVALSVPLVFGAALLTRGLIALHRIDPGFAIQATLAVDLSLRGSAYEPPHRQRATFEAIEDRIRQVPGVVHVGSVNNVPLGAGTSGIAIEVEDRSEQPGQATGAQYRVVTPGYFGTIGVPFVAGRDFAPADARLALPLIRWYPQQPTPAGANLPQPIPVAIVNESMAKSLWPDGAIGRRFRVLFSPWITVVGVVRDMRTVSLQARTGPEFYLSAGQEPQAALTVLARTANADVDVAPAVRAAIGSVDPSLPIGAMQALEDIVAVNFRQPRFMSVLLGAFAGASLILMAVGVYGLLAFTTAQRLPEIGVRVALGATRRQVGRLVLSSAVWTVGVGLLIGLAAALGLGRLIADQLFGVAPDDPSMLGLVTLVVVLAVGLACWRPVRHAARVDPIAVLRHE